LQPLSVGWNDAFRKVFQYYRWQSVKMLQCLWKTEFNSLILPAEITVFSHSYDV